jgi:hypothetical protein
MGDYQVTHHCRDVIFIDQALILQLPHFTVNHGHVMLDGPKLLGQRFW